MKANSPACPARYMARCMAIASLWLLALLVGSVSGTARAAVDVPPYQAFVTDLAGTLSATERSVLEQRLQQIHQLQFAELAILLVPTTAEESIFDFSMRVAEQWKVGNKDQDNGILLVIAIQDRTSQILVGYGLEGTLTDVASSRILRDVIPPFFRRGDFGGGLNAAVDAIMAVVQREAGAQDSATSATSARTSPQGGTELPFWAILGGMGWVMFARGILRRLFGKPLAGLATAGVAAAVGLVSGLPLQLLLFLVIFLTLFVIGENRGRGGRSRRGGFGGGFGGGGFGGGGFGGGGGGSFGGGGASGRW